MEEKTDMMPQKPLSSVMRSARCRARMREKWPVSEERRVFCLSVEVRAVVEVGVVGAPFFGVRFDIVKVNFLSSSWRRKSGGDVVVVFGWVGEEEKERERGSFQFGANDQSLRCDGGQNYS